MASYSTEACDTMIEILYGVEILEIVNPTSERDKSRLEKANLHLGNMKAAHYHTNLLTIPPGMLEPTLRSTFRYPAEPKGELHTLMANLVHVSACQTPAITKSRLSTLEVDELDTTDWDS